MNLEIKEKWIAALESGNYEQGVGFLKTKAGYYCLGVLCDVFIKEKGLEWNYGTDTYLPQEVKDWSGIHSDAGKYTDKGQSRYLADDNDTKGLSFLEISKIIEKHF